MAEKVPCWIADRTINDNRRVVTYHDTRVSHFGVVVFRRRQSLLCEKSWRIFQLRKSYSFEASEIGTEIDMSLLLTEYDFFPQADNIWNKIIDSSEGDNLKWIKRGILWKKKFVEKFCKWEILCGKIVDNKTIHLNSVWKSFDVMVE